MLPFAVELAQNAYAAYELGKQGYEYYKDYSPYVYRAGRGVKRKLGAFLQNEQDLDDSPAMRRMRRYSRRGMLMRRRFRRRRRVFRRSRRVFRRRRAFRRRSGVITSLLRFETDIKLDSNGVANNSLYFHMGTLRTKINSAYIHMFDEFKILSISVVMRHDKNMSATDNAITELWWTYDPDLTGRKIDMDNIKMVRRARSVHLGPMGKKVLKCYPIFVNPTKLEGGEQQQTISSRGSAYNRPWFDAAGLNVGYSDAMKSHNGIAWALEGQPGRGLRLDYAIRIAWRGRRDGQTYTGDS
ncbi:putative capsid protein [Otevirus soksuewis]|uniref:Putative capsid protein n=1 Tax=Palaemonetes sp. common grass shrimp associated circular virus TaxID=1692259 RepID=A0A0K1RL70_9CIRC|nr:putative capsid protein [Palaemonetes sp. common grass shrimp associated circular virus]AKV62301.1 putative capsid protein [Palaemonetes sp. common grass shrimp associated circular virus]